MILTESVTKKPRFVSKSAGSFMKTLILVDGAVTLSQSMFLLSYAAAAGVDLNLFDSSMLRGICINQDEFWGDTVAVFST